MGYKSVCQIYKNSLDVLRQRYLVETQCIASLRQSHSTTDRITSVNGTKILIVELFSRFLANICYLQQPPHIALQERLDVNTSCTNDKAEVWMEGLFEEW